MDETPQLQVQARRIPIIGRLTLFELLGFVGAILMAIFGATTFASLWPMLDDIAAPGSGGGAQMIAAMFVFPMLYGSGLMVMGGCVGFALLLIVVRNRLTGRNSDRTAAIEPAVDVQTLKRSMQILTASLIAEILLQVFPSFVPAWSTAFAVAVALTSSVAALVFLICLGKLAAHLGKNWVLWVILTMFVPPFGPFIAYFLMRKAVKDAVRDARARTHR